jgi:uncharacterized membrane protein/Mg-chelatase subunit ChlD
MTFVYPHMLWLLLLLPPLWWLTLRAAGRLPPLRFWSSLLLRSALLIALIGSLAGAQLVSPSHRLTTIFLVDQSDSISLSARGRALVFVQEALTAMRAGDRAGLVVFGQEALVERVPIERRDSDRFLAEPAATSTDIASAIQLGMALFPSDAQKRLVLLSDGGENQGQALAAVEMAAARHIPIEVVDLSGPVVGDEAMVAHLDAPAYAFEGQRVELTITVESTTDQPAHLTIFADQEVVESKVVQLAAGSQQFRATVDAVGAGFRRYRAWIDPQRDEHIQNNEASALVQVQGPPRVLLVAGQPGDARNLSDALDAAHMEAETIAPQDLPTDLTGLSRYDGVVLVNVAAWTLPPGAMATLPAYVHDLGRGLVMIGGTESYGVGGYGNTPVEGALPVSMDVQPEQGRPDVAIVFVLDRSSSMADCHCTGPDRRTYTTMPGGEYKVNIAKEAVVQASALLNQDDILGIVAFDSTAYVLFPAAHNPDPASVAAAIAPMEPWGRTNVEAGLLEAEAALADIDAGIKHAILLTDGWNEGSENETIAGPMIQQHYAIVQRMHEKGITLSTIAAGSGSAPYLAELARLGGGRYYPAENMHEVPTIFLKETVTVAGNYLIEQPFVPRVAMDSAIVRGLSQDDFPTLYGHNGSTLKPRARLFLDSPEQVPLLAGWNYGLGRSLAWTSDMSGRWAHDWVTWQAFPRFAAQLVQWVLPTRSQTAIETNIHMEDGQTMLTAELPGVSEGVSETMQLSARLVASDLSGKPDGSTMQQTVDLVQTSPGSYQARIPVPPPGSYLVQFAGQAGGATVAQETAGLVVPYSAEYRPNQGNPALLEAIARRSGGKPLTKPEASFSRTVSNVRETQEIDQLLLVLALLLFPCDIAVRRILTRRTGRARRQRASRRGWGRK